MPPDTSQSPIAETIRKYFSSSEWAHRAIFKSKVRRAKATIDVSTMTWGMRCNLAISGMRYHLVMGFPSNLQSLGCLYQMKLVRFLRCQ